MLTIKELTDIKDILKWARMQAKTEGMHQRIVNYEKIVINEISQESDKRIENVSFISRDTLKSLVKLSKYPDFKLNIEITSPEPEFLDDSDIIVAVRVVLLNVIKSAIELREQL